MTIHLSIPSRINILGNPGDANEGDFAVLSAAIEIRAQAEIGPADEIVFEQSDADTSVARFPVTSLPLVYDNQHDLLKGAVNRLWQFSAEFREKLAKGGFHLKVRSDVPRQSGLGGSSLFVLLALSGLRELYKLDRRTHNDYILSELTQRVEAQELGIAAGFADRYVPLFGGLAYVDYRGKLLQTDIQTEPYATYERLDAIAPPVTFVAISTGVRHNSGDVHGRMRPRYLQEHADWLKRGGELPPMVRFMSAAWDCAWKGKIALLQNNLAIFGSLMNENHRLVDEMMRYCGFEDGAGWANNLFIETALRHDALGAKLTGAGGGGSVFALVPPGREEYLLGVWGKLARDRGLNEAYVYQLKIAKQGLIVSNQ
jgi:D-glycero-alpha-D-manno-heptose-7-phosphate kinase